MNRFPKIAYAALLGAMVLLAGSCGKSDDCEAVYSVTGKVLYKGKPAAGATVTFFRSDAGDSKTPHPGGQTNDRGEFRLSTYRSYDGAPAGRYAVTVVYPSSEKTENDENAGPDLLKGRYGNPKTTPLHVEVKASENNLEPFQL